MWSVSEVIGGCEIVFDALTDKIGIVNVNGESTTEVDIPFHLTHITDNEIREVYVKSEMASIGVAKYDLLLKFKCPIN